MCYDNMEGWFSNLKMIVLDSDLLLRDPRYVNILVILQQATDCKVVFIKSKNWRSNCISTYQSDMIRRNRKIKDFIHIVDFDKMEDRQITNLFSAFTGRKGISVEEKFTGPFEHLINFDHYEHTFNQLAS